MGFIANLSIVVININIDSSENREEFGDWLLDMDEKEFNSPAKLVNWATDILVENQFYSSVLIPLRHEIKPEGGREVRPV